MRRRLIILGTGTDVGKTYISSALATALGAHPSTAAVIALKPVESGVISNDPDETHRSQVKGPASDPLAAVRRSDAEILARSSSPQILRPSHAYALKEAISPHLSARRAGVTIELDRVKAWIEQQETNLLPKPAVVRSSERREPEVEWVIIETAGATFSPLSIDATNLDLTLRLEPATWILVAPDRLGVLHDLRATIHTMRSLARAPDSVVLSCPELPDLSTGTNAPELRWLGITNVDMEVGHGGDVPNSYVDRLLAMNFHRGD